MNFKKKKKEKELDLLSWETQRTPCSGSEWGGKQKQWVKLGNSPSGYNLPAGPAIVEMEGNFSGNLDWTSRHIFMLSHEMHFCLCQGTELSSGRFCGLLEWLLEFNDLKCLPLSGAKNGSTGLPPTDWLYKRTPAESLWPDTFSQKGIKSNPCGARWQPLVSAVLFPNGHKSGWGFAIFLGKSCP